MNSTSIPDQKRTIYPVKHRKICKTEQRIKHHRIVIDSPRESEKSSEFLQLKYLGNGSSATPQRKVTTSGDCASLGKLQMVQKRNI